MTDEVRRAVGRFESAQTDPLDEARIARLLRMEAEQHRAVLRRSKEALLNNVRIYR